MRGGWVRMCVWKCVLCMCVCVYVRACLCLLHGGRANCVPGLSRPGCHAPLQTIDRLKINANHENKDVRIQKTLGDMAKPKRFELKNGKKVEVHTPFTTRAQELQQLYSGLNMPQLSVEERMDVLLHVKWTVKEFDCNLSREIVDLIDREADLINRGRAEKTLEGLRKRISSLFLNFIEVRVHIWSGGGGGGGAALGFPAACIWGVLKCPNSQSGILLLIR